MNTILIIEDDPGLLATVTSALESEGMKVISATDGRLGLELATHPLADLILLDWDLPSLDGYEICRSLRSQNIRTPIIMLTGKRISESDTVTGLDTGADDYLIKPFGMRELIARIQAVLRRIGLRKDDEDEYAFSDVSVHFGKKLVIKANRSVHLTSRELDLLKLLITNRDKVIDRETILNKVWGYECFPNTRTVDTFVHNIRKKIEDDPANPAHIITVHWAGYKFVG